MIHKNILLISADIAESKTACLFREDLSSNKMVLVMHYNVDATYFIFLKVVGSSIVFSAGELMKNLFRVA